MQPATSPRTQPERKKPTWTSRKCHNCCNSWRGSSLAQRFPAPPANAITQSLREPSGKRQRISNHVTLAGDLARDGGWGGYTLPSGSCGLSGVRGAHPKFRAGRNRKHLLVGALRHLEVHDENCIIYLFALPVEQRGCRLGMTRLPGGRDSIASTEALSLPATKGPMKPFSKFENDTNPFGVQR